MSRLRSNLYKSARILGDIEAIEKGPTSYVKRRVRRKVYGQWNRLLRSALRSVKL